MKKNLFITFCTVMIFYSCNSTNNVDSMHDTVVDIASTFSQEFNISCVNSLQSHTGTQLEMFPVEKAYGPPLGCGNFCGSTDAFVIGRGQEVIFENTQSNLKDGEGVDFKVFENGFTSVGTGSSYFLDFGFVEISSDGNIWYGFEPVFAGNITSPLEKENLVGLNTVSVNYENNRIDPKTEEAGGDGFDISMAKKITNRSDRNPLKYEYGEVLPTNANIQYIKIVDLTNVLGLPSLYNGVDVDAICFFYFE